MNNKTKLIFIIIGLVILLVGVFGFVLAKTKLIEDDNFNYAIPAYDKNGLVASLGEIEKTEVVPPVKHLKTPTPLQAVYMTSCVAVTPSLRERLINLVETTEINAIVLDLKDYTGAISFTPISDELKPYAISHCPIKDLKSLVEEWHDKGIYVIGRVTVFQDPLFTKNNPEVAVKSLALPTEMWKDKKGLTYIDPASKLAHDHIIEIAKDAYAQGVDELNFDYIRFPSDGKMSDIWLPITKSSTAKPEVLESFFAYLQSELKPTGMIISADVFGVITSTFVDVGIGQLWEHFLPYFDYVSPMVYPSHYYAGFGNITKPNLYPYEVVYGALEFAVTRTLATSTTIKTLQGKPIASTSPQLYTKPVFSINKIRPWLQDFDYPVPYTPSMVLAQIKATYDVGLDSFMMWDPTNTYTSSVYKPSLLNQ